MSTSCSRFEADGRKLQLPQGFSVFEKHTLIIQKTLACLDNTAPNNIITYLFASSALA